MWIVSGALAILLSCSWPLINELSEVVEDARQKFDSAAVGVPQPPLPIPPSISRSVSQSRTSSRLPRKVLAANQIFSDRSASSMSTSVNVDAPGRVDKTLPPIPSEDANRVTDFLAASTPPRPRRATITTRSPAALKEQASFDVDTGSPSKRKEKSKSQGNLLRPIATIDRLELELQKGMSLK
jgi:serine/threonine-protein kinase GIN4